MKHTLSLLTGLPLLAATMLTTHAANVTIIDQGNYDASGQSALNRIQASDFVLGSGVGLDGAEVSVWLHDLGTNDLVFENMASGFSWAILSDDGAGSPGSGDGAVFATGFVPVSAGVYAGPGFGGDTFRFDFTLSAALPTLPGTYWLALHENSWKSPAETVLPHPGWAHSLDPIEGSPMRQSIDPTVVGPWFPSSTADNAFRIVAIPEPSRALLTLLGLAAIPLRRRRS